MPNRFLKSFACSGLPRSVQTTVYFLDRWPQIKCNVTLYLHLFLIQFFMLFHMVASVLLSMVAFPTTFLLVETLSQKLWNKRLLKLPWRTKCRLPCERAYKTVSETYVKSDLAFCLRPHIKKQWAMLPKINIFFQICNPNIYPVIGK